MLFCPESAVTCGQVSQMARGSVTCGLQQRPCKPPAGIATIAEHPIIERVDLQQSIIKQVNDPRC